MSADPNRVPWGNMYEFTLAGTFVVALFYLVLQRRYALAWLGPVVVTFVLTLLMVAVSGSTTPTGPLPEALNCYWLVIHVVSAIIATGAFTLGGMTSVGLPAQARAAARDAAADRPLGAGAVAGEARPDLLPDPRLRLPGVDLRGADHRPDLGAPGLVVVLELGPQGGLGVHHLGRLRRLPPRPHHRRLAGRNAAILALVGTATLWFNFIGINYFSTLQPALLRRRAAPFQQPE